MRIYLVQHGQAKPKDVDPDRHLTEQGRDDVERMSAFLKQLGLRVGAVWHSGKVRAAQTAEILGSVVIADGTVVQHDGLGPNDAIGAVKEELIQAREDLMIVGHLPFLSKLASELVVGSETTEVVAFAPGGVVCLEQDESRTWKLTWAITPELVQ